MSARWGRSSWDLLSTKPHLSSSDSASTADEQIRVAASLSVPSPPAEMVSCMCEEGDVSFNEAENPDIGGNPEAAPTEQLDTNRGLAPASDAAMAALRAAGPSPSTKTSQDSITIGTCQWGRYDEHDAPNLSANSAYHSVE